MRKQFIIKSQNNCVGTIKFLERTCYDRVDFTPNKGYCIVIIKTDENKNDRFGYIQKDRLKLKNFVLYKK